MNRIRYACGAAVIAALLGLSLKRASGPDAGQAILFERTAPNVVYAVADTSSSDRHALPATAVGIAGLSVALSSDTTWLTVFRLDAHCDEVASSPLHGSDEDAVAELAQKFQPSAKEDNTYLDLPLAAIAERAKSLSGRCVVVMFTDWFGEGMSADQHRRAVESAKALAENEHVLAVVVAGVDPKRMTTMRSDLAPLAGKFYPVTGTFDPEVVAGIFARGGLK